MIWEMSCSNELAMKLVSQPAAATLSVLLLFRFLILLFQDSDRAMRAQWRLPGMRGKALESLARYMELGKTDDAVKDCGRSRWTTRSDYQVQLQDKSWITVDAKSSGLQARHCSDARRGVDARPGDVNYLGFVLPHMKEGRDCDRFRALLYTPDGILVFDFPAKDKVRNAFLFASFYGKTIILPRQARDKHS